MVRSIPLQDWIWAALRGESGGHRDCCIKVTFRRFSDVKTIATGMATAASNSPKVADSISVLDSYLTLRFMKLVEQLLHVLLPKSNTGAGVIGRRVGP